MTFPDGYAAASFEQREDALRLVIYGYTFVTALTGVFIWFVIPDIHPAEQHEQHERGTVLTHIIEVLKIPAVWLQALVVICAYVAYKGYDNYTLFAVQAWGMDEVDAAFIVVTGSWLRPVACLAAGLLADRFSVSRIRSEKAAS